MLPLRFWNCEGGTLEASHSLLIRRSLFGDVGEVGEAESTRISSLPATFEISSVGVSVFALLSVEAIVMFVGL